MSGSSIVPSTAEWVARICSTRVEPALGNPTMKIGAVEAAPPPSRAEKKASVNIAFARRIDAVVSWAL